MSWTNQEIYPYEYKGRRNRTPRIVMYLRMQLMFLLVFQIGIYAVTYAFDVSNTGTHEKQFNDWLFIMKIVVVLFHLVLACYWIGQQFNNHMYTEGWLQQGGSPFWDTIHYPFNTDSHRVKMGQVDPLCDPSYYGVDVDWDWENSCPNCRCPIPEENAHCFVCEMAECEDRFFNPPEGGAKV